MSKSPNRTAKAKPLYLRLQEEFETRMRDEAEVAQARFRQEKGARIPTSLIFRGEADVPRSLSPPKKPETPKYPQRTRPRSPSSPYKSRIQAESRVAAYISGRTTSIYPPRSSAPPSEAQSSVGAPTKPAVKTPLPTAPKKSVLKKPAMAKVDWTALASKLPTGADDVAKGRRKQLFDQFDPNGNGYLSLAEVDKGIKETLGSDGLYDAKPAVLRAFQAAKESVKSKGELGGDFVERREFRNLLVYLRMYFELFQMFGSVDSTDDRRIDIEEFRKATAAIVRWGLVIPDPDAEFASIDKNGGGVILFNEFADWAIRHKLDLENDDE